MNDQRNWLEKLGDKIPGYGGYASRERRRDIDKLHREHLANRLRSVKQPISSAVRELTSGGRLMEIGPLDRVQKKIDQAENRVRFASYGYAGFFDVVKVQDEQLERLYHFDLALVEKVEEIERQAGELGGQAATAGGLKEAAVALELAVDELNRTFDERHKSIDGFRSDDQSGQPMFS
jgi:hypothetical protein